MTTLDIGAAFVLGLVVVAAFVLVAASNDEQMPRVIDGLLTFFFKLAAVFVGFHFAVKYW